MAIRIEGKLLAAQVKERVAAGVKELKEKGIEPCLAVIMVGENPASQVYVKVTIFNPLAEKQKYEVVYYHPLADEKMYIEKKRYHASEKNKFL